MRVIGCGSECIFRKLGLPLSGELAGDTAEGLEGMVSMNASLENALNIAGRIPLFMNAGELKVEALQGVISLNNSNYRVEANGKTYLLRIGAEAARLLGIRREEEIECAKAAALAGAGPEVLYADPSGVILSSFISGRHWTREELQEPANILRIAEALQRLHSIKTVGAQGSEFRRIERLLESAINLGMTLPPEVDSLEEKLKRIESNRLCDPGYSSGLAHNDFWPNNFLDDGEKLVLVDWEFSGTGDTLVDLATISMGAGYSEEEELLLLQAYGLTDASALKSLHTMKWVASFFEALWALVMHGIRESDALNSPSPGEFDYLKHSNTMFAKLYEV